MTPDDLVNAPLGQDAKNTVEPGKPGANEVTPTGAWPAGSPMNAADPSLVHNPGAHAGAWLPHLVTNSSE